MRNIEDGMSLLLLIIWQIRLSFLIGLWEESDRYLEHKAHVSITFFQL